MKVVSSKQMAEIESRAYVAGCEERQFMEEAGSGVARFIIDYLRYHCVTPEIVLLSGKGNNGGDAYVAGCHLLKEGYKVHAFQVGDFDHCSPLCRENGLKFQEAGGSVISDVDANTIAFPVDGLIIDGLLGTGMQGAARPPFDALIRAANSSQLPIISIDIPSGLDGDSGKGEGEVISASLTLFLGLPKRGFFLRDGWNVVGKLSYVDFGLPEALIREESSLLEMITDDQFAKLLPPIIRNRHKYEAGYVVGLAGSPGMPGAANLAATATLKAGAGIVRLLHPKGMEVELSSSIYELIKTAYDTGDVETVLQMMARASAVFIGPGMGMKDETHKLLKELLPKLTVPTVLDADALNILATTAIELPKDVVITPHIGEMCRLLGKEEKRAPLTEAFLNECASYAEKRRVTLILKGGPSFIFTAGRPIVVSPTGDPGMATAGSGDVLTGVVAAMLAQGLDPHAAATAAVYLHGLAGEYAAEEKTSYCMTASDIIAHFPEAFS